MQTMSEGARVLLVEDNDIVAKCVRDLLSGAGYVVSCADCAEDAWALFRQQGALAVITDNAMRGDPMDDTSGLDLAVMIKTASPRTPVVMLTAAPPHGADAVCDLVLEKPGGIRTLVAALARLGV